MVAGSLEVSPLYCDPHSFVPVILYGFQPGIGSSREPLGALGSRGPTRPGRSSRRAHSARSAGRRRCSSSSSYKSFLR